MQQEKSYQDSSEAEILRGDGQLQNLPSSSTRQRRARSEPTPQLGESSTAPKRRRMSTMSIPGEQVPREQRTENRSLIPLRVWEFVEFLSRQLHYPELLALIGSASAIRDSVWLGLGLLDVEEKMKARACANRPGSKILVGTQMIPCWACGQTSCECETVVRLVDPEHPVCLKTAPTCSPRCQSCVDRTVMAHFKEPDEVVPVPQWNFDDWGSDGDLACDCRSIHKPSMEHVYVCNPCYDLPDLDFARVRWGWEGTLDVLVNCSECSNTTTAGAAQWYCPCCNEQCGKAVHFP